MELILRRHTFFVTYTCIPNIKQLRKMPGIRFHFDLNIFCVLCLYRLFYAIEKMSKNSNDYLFSDESIEIAKKY